MKTYIVIVEVREKEERWNERLSDNRDTAMQEARKLVDKRMRERNVPSDEYRFVNIIEP